MNKLILLRHGQSQWNLENRFTGWKNVPLTEKGESEAKKAGELIKKQVSVVDTNARCDYGCFVLESVIMPLDRETLDKWKNTEIKLRFEGNGMQKDITINSLRIHNLLNKVNEIQKSLNSEE